MIPERPKPPKQGVDDFIQATGASAEDVKGLPRMDPPREPATLTDAGNAQRFAIQHGGHVRYCYAQRSWFVFTGTHWRRDPGDTVARLAKETARNIYLEAAQIASEDRRKATGQWAAKSEDERRLRAMLTLAQSEPGIPVLADELDADGWLLNCANGTLDLKTGTLQPHRRDDLITRLVPVAYEPAAACPTWLRFLARIFEGRPALIPFLQRAIGYALTGDTSEQCFFLFHGAGSNGKTTFIETTAALLDAYAQRLAIETLLARRPGDAVAMNDLFTIMGARFVSAVEPDMGRRLAEAVVKQLTGGDTIKAKKLYTDLLSYRPTFKLFLSTNHKPTIRGTDHAIWRRIKLVPFDVVIPDAEQDRTLPEQLRQEQAGILAWAVQGCLAWQRDGLGTPDEVRAATTRYRAEMDTLGEFLAECYVQEKAAWVSAAALYTTYLDWTKQAGELAISKQALGSRLADRGLQPMKSQQQRGWLGLRPADTGTHGTHRDTDSDKPPSRAREGGFYENRVPDTSDASQDDLPAWVTETEEAGP
jgi:putative DNA primase/helicase